MRRCVTPMPASAPSWGSDAVAPGSRLKGRHALLTGAGGGIDLAVTGAFVTEGACGTVVDLRFNNAAQFLDRVEAACITAQTLSVDGGNVTR